MAANFLDFYNGKTHVLAAPLGLDFNALAILNTKFMPWSSNMCTCGSSKLMSQLAPAVCWLVH